MKKLALVVALVVSVIALGDGNVPSNTPNATPVAIISQAAGTTCVTAVAAAGSQATATVPGIAGQFFYITWLDITYSAIAAPAATLMATTTTNFPGTFTVSQPMQAAVGDSARSFSLAIPLKSAVVGTATVVTGNAGVTSISQNIRICGFYAP